MLDTFLVAYAPYVEHMCVRMYSPGTKKGGSIHIRPKRANKPRDELNFYAQQLSLLMPLLLLLLLLLLCFLSRKKGALYATSDYSVTISSF